MLRSFDYAAYAALFEYTRSRTDDFDRLEPWARLWQAWISAAFWREYRAVSGKAPYLTDDPTALGLLLDAYTLDKILYELLYELNNRPDWVGIPLQGIASLVEREQAGPAQARAPAPTKSPGTITPAGNAGPIPAGRDHRHAAQRLRPVSGGRGDALPVVGEARRARRRPARYAGHGLRRLGAQRRRGLGGWRLQRLGPRGPPDASPRGGRHLGGFHPGRRAGHPVSILRSRLRAAVRASKRPTPMASTPTGGPTPPRESGTSRPTSGETATGCPRGARPRRPIRPSPSTRSISAPGCACPRRTTAG